LNRDRCVTTSYDCCQIEQCTIVFKRDGLKNPHHRLSAIEDLIGISIAPLPLQLSFRRLHMRTPLASKSAAISIGNKKLHAATCAQCGAKMYPSSLLKPHLTRHRVQHEWFVTELTKLRDTIERMRVA
jgi:hypothetical protein